MAAAASAAIRVGARYDLVLRLRPDLCFCGPLDLRPALRSPGSYWLPWAAPKAGLAFDQIAIGNPSVMALYASAYHASVAQEVEVDRRELYPEAVMWRHLERRGGVSASTAITRAGKGAAGQAAAGRPSHTSPASEPHRASQARRLAALRRPVRQAEAGPDFAQPRRPWQGTAVSPVCRAIRTASWSPSPRASCTQPSCNSSAQRLASRLAARAAHGG